MTDGYATLSRERRIALIGHDLRSAVGDVIGGLQLLDEAGLDPDALLQLERVRAASETLGRLVDEAVTTLAGEPVPGDRAALEARQALTLLDFVRDQERRWAGHAAAQGLAMAVEFGPGLPDVVSLPPLTLERIIGNLLDNAHKFAQRGRIVLAVDLAACGSLSVSVRDAGPGFSDAEAASQYLIREHSICTVPWDNAGAYLRFSLTYRAETEQAEDALMAEMKKRLSGVTFTW